MIFWIIYREFSEKREFFGLTRYYLQFLCPENSKSGIYFSRPAPEIARYLTQKICFSELEFFQTLATEMDIGFWFYRSKTQIENKKGPFLDAQRAEKI